MNRAGLYPTAAAIKMISFNGEKAPNIGAQSAGRRERTRTRWPSRCREPSYDEAQGTLRFRVKPLGTVRRTGLRAYENDLDSALPESFGPSALFVDAVKVDPNPIVESCFMSIRFVKASIPIYFLGAQDLIPNGGHWKRIRQDGPCRAPTGSMRWASSGPTTSFAEACSCSGCHRSQVPARRSSVHMDNPYLSASDWVLSGRTGTWICHIDGNSHGQPLRVAATSGVERGCPGYWSSSSASG